MIAYTRRAVARAAKGTGFDYRKTRLWSTGTAVREHCLSFGAQVFFRSSPRALFSADRDLQLRTTHLPLWSIIAVRNFGLRYASAHEIQRASTTVCISCISKNRRRVDSQ